MDRRSFLKLMVAGPSGLILGVKPGTAMAGELESLADPVGVLVDASRCIACLKCEGACAAINSLPTPDHSKEATDKNREMTDKAYTVVNKYKTKTGKRVNVKTQCMHCAKPGCKICGILDVVCRLDSADITEQRFAGKLYAFIAIGGFVFFFNRLLFRIG